MARPVALRVALDLAAAPVLARLAANQPLPPGMITVLKIAGGCKTSLQDAAESTGESAERIRGAATLFLQTVLFAPAADSYRILGAERSATQAELREHMRWLMKWLHPDHEGSEWESSLALRVSTAWDDLKSAERRKRYDEAHVVRLPDTASSAGGGRRQPRTRIPWIPQPLPQDLGQRRAMGRAVALALIALMGAGVAASLWGWPSLVESFDWRAYAPTAAQTGSAAR